MSELSLLLAIIIVLFTLFVVLLERKFLAYAQRRMGPTTMGRNGLGQIVLDLVKLMTKETFLIPRPSSLLAPLFLAILYGSQLMFTQHLVWAPSLFLFWSVESVILLHLVTLLFANIMFTLVGIISQSKYAMIGTVRAIVHTLSLDIFLTLVYALLILLAQSAHFYDFVLQQQQTWTFLLVGPAVSIFIVILIVESKRAPFDHAETESEVVAGYAVEYSGSMLLVFYLAEYLHLVIAGFHFIIFFGGGWWGFSLTQLFPTTFWNWSDVSAYGSAFSLYFGV